jgi:hypothetical protein
MASVALDASTLLELFTLRVHSIITPNALCIYFTTAPHASQRRARRLDAARAAVAAVPGAVPADREVR